MIIGLYQEEIAPLTNAERYQYGITTVRGRYQYGSRTVADGVGLVGKELDYF